MVKITKIKVGRGKTEHGLLTYYELEGSIEDESELELTRANMKGLIDGWLGGVTQQPALAPATAPGELFPQPLRDMLQFEYTSDYTIIRPRKFLGKDNFAKVATIVKGAGGEYISQGKQSHFKIPRK